MRRVVRSNPLGAFWVLTGVFSWWAWPLYLAGWSPSPVVGFGPAVAAVAVLALTKGRGGLHRLWASMTRWRVGWRWYTFVLGIPVLISIVAATLNVAFGAETPSAEDLARWPDVLQVFVLYFLWEEPVVLYFLVPGIGGTWEEPGFRGYAFPRLRERYSWMLAGGVLGCGWVVWHLPLLVHGIIYWPDVLLILAASMVFAWLVEATRSVLLAMTLHTANNAVGVGFFIPMFTGDDAVRQSLLLALGWVVTAFLGTMRGWRTQRA